jgi:chorismate mutase
MVRDKKTQVVRTLGDGEADWVDFEINEDFELFVDSIREGLFTFTLSPIPDDPQLNASSSAMLMQLAMAGGISIETAIKNSNMPNRMDIVKEIAEYKVKTDREQAAQMVDVQMVQQLAMQTGLSPEQVNEFVNKVQLERYKQLNQQNNKQNQNGQGLGTIQQQAAEPIRQQNIQQ